VADEARISQRRLGVLVDADGTLLDTNYLHTIAWSRAFRDVGASVPMNAIHRLVGMGGDHLVPELLGEDVTDAHDAHKRHYADLKDEIRPFAGAASLLRRLHAAGLAVVLATSASEEDVGDLLRALDADDAIDEVVHAGDVPRSKPAPDIFEAARDKAGIDPDRVLAIGDSVWDVRAARSAGMGCIAVESGGTSRHELSEAGALSVYRDAQELGTQLFTSPVMSLVVAAPAAGQSDADGLPG
jgi:HAD superfamily hydrolase (TIGR01509 family)